MQLGQQKLVETLLTALNITEVLIRLNIQGLLKRA